ncbi:MAG TPA: hypothetical protein VJA47_01735 [archaeon]|nr:hypothetical protein [archaeon]
MIFKKSLLAVGLVGSIFLQDCATFRYVRRDSQPNMQQSELEEFLPDYKPRETRKRKSHSGRYFQDTRMLKRDVDMMEYPFC